MPTTALIAEDEPVLAQALATLLTRLWPGLVLLPPARDGEEAQARALAELPDLLFMDIQMPVCNGLDAAEAIIEAWPQTTPLPLLVFVTAYDEYAVAAFERAAVDYVLKPAQTQRLAATCERLQAQLKLRALAAPSDEPDDQAALATLRALQDTPLGAAAPAEQRLAVIQADVGASLYMIPVDEVLYFEAADKYVKVIPAQPERYPGEILLRTPLRQLAPRLDPQRFWQIHRGTVVNITAIERVMRDDGRLRVYLRGRPEVLEVSRMYASRFRGM